MAIIHSAKVFFRKVGLYRYTEGSTCLSILYLVLGLVACCGHRLGLSNTVRVPLSDWLSLLGIPMIQSRLYREDGKTGLLAGREL